MHIAFKEKLALHILRAAAIPLPSRQKQTTCKKSLRKKCAFYTWLQDPNERKKKLQR